MLLISLGFADPTPALAYEIVPVVYSASTSDDIIEAYAVHYAVQADILKKVIACESRGNPYALGDKGHSRGLVQISDIWHPEISDEEAYDPMFSIDYLASQIKRGRGHEWTCYRKITKGHSMG